MCRSPIVYFYRNKTTRHRFVTLQAATKGTQAKSSEEDIAFTCWKETKIHNHEVILPRRRDENILRYPSTWASIGTEIIGNSKLRKENHMSTYTLQIKTKWANRLQYPTFWACDNIYSHIHAFVRWAWANSSAWQHSFCSSNQKSWAKCVCPQTVTLDSIFILNNRIEYAKRVCVA